MSQPLRFRVGTWNVRAIRGFPPARASRVRDALARHAPDLMMLQEVSTATATADQVRDVLDDVGLTHQYYSGRPQAETKRYGNVIASRWPLLPIEWPIATRWPQLIAAAGLATPDGVMTVVGTHIPNGSGNGWDKIYAFEALAEGLREIRGPLVLSGDFNEPMSAPPQWLSFGATRQGRLEGTRTDQFGRTHARQRWQDAVAAVLDDSNPAGLTAWGGGQVGTQTGASFEATHIVHGRFQRYFDHILIREMSGVQDVVYDHSVRIPPNACSDHSLLLATIDACGPARPG